MLGDVRLLNVFCFLLLSLFCLIRQNDDKQRVLKPEFLFLFFAIPNSLFVNEQAWTDLPLVVLLFLLATCFQKPGFFIAGVLTGLVVAYKQYALIAVLLVFISWFRLLSKRDLLLRVFVSGLTFLIIVLPFCLTNWPAFYDSTVSGYVKALPRADSSNIPNIVKYYFQEEMPVQVWACISLGGLLFFIRRQFTENNTRQNLLLNISLAYAAVFLFGKQAFANYFYLCVGLFILSGAVSENEARNRINKK